jgi:hypothetical protein
MVVVAVKGANTLSLHARHTDLRLGGRHVVESPDAGQL